MFWEICNCPHYFESIDEQSKPCHSILQSQVREFLNIDQTQPDLEKLPRPIPWVGDIHQKELMFLHCSPNIPDILTIPTWEDAPWPVTEVVNFEHNTHSQPYKLELKTFDRSKHESNKSNTEKQTFRLDRQILLFKFAQEISNLILENKKDEVQAEADFTLVNLVRCPSKSKSAILGALNFCSTNWLLPTILESKSKIIFVLGQKPASVLSRLFPDQVPVNWGSFSSQGKKYGQGFWPRSKGDLQDNLTNGAWDFQHQKKNTFRLKLGDRVILVVFYSTPGSGALWSIKNHPSLVSKELIAYWRYFLAENA